MHEHGLMALYEVGSPAIAAQQLLQLVAGNARQDRRIGDLVAVQMQYGQHGAIGGGIQELVGMPGGGQRSCLGLAVADHTAHHQL